MRETAFIQPIWLHPWRDKALGWFFLDLRIPMIGMEV
jgi:hypothetical protein